VSCDTNSPHPSPTTEKTVKRDGQRKERERKQEVYLPDKAHAQSLAAGWLSLFSPELRENRA